jgi:hypothetical protein
MEIQNAVAIYASSTRVAKTTCLSRTGSPRSRYRPVRQSFQSRLELARTTPNRRSDDHCAEALSQLNPSPPFRSALRGIDLRQPLPIPSAYRSVATP